MGGLSEIEIAPPLVTGWTTYTIEVGMDVGATIPDIVPVMTLRETILFPRAILPLYIFEPRYRQMLQDVLQAQRMFAIVCQDESEDADADAEEPPHKVATVGVVRASQKNPDGTTNLILQGIERVRILEIVSEDPYRTVRVEVLPSAFAVDPSGAIEDRYTIRNMIEDHAELCDALPEEFVKFLLDIEDLGSFCDLVSFSLCEDVSTKQRLLETQAIDKRYALLRQYLEERLATFQIYRELQGHTRDDEIELN